MFGFNIIPPRQVKVKSTLDKELYIVNNSELKNQVAYTLSLLKQKINILINNLETTNKDIYQKLKNRMKNTVFRENNVRLPKNNETSYSMNKGEELVLCVVNYKNMKIYNMDILFYVAVHELSHVANDSYGHDKSFYTIFNFLLEKSIFYGLYSFSDFQNLPSEYCGLHLK